MNLNKCFILGVALLCATFSMHAQQSEAFVSRTNVKLSALAAIGIVNPAVEFRVDEKWSVQLEGMGVFAAENFLGTGYPLQMGAAFVEARWYPKGVFRMFFLAPNVGGGAFRMNKNILHKFFGWAPDLGIRIGPSKRTGASAGSGRSMRAIPTKGMNWCYMVRWGEVRNICRSIGAIFLWRISGKK